MILHTIPIYGITPELLEKRSRKAEEEFRTRYASSGEEMLQLAVENEFYPQRIWKYNHIVGYIEICYEKSDIIFKMYCSKSNKIYRWKDSARILMRDIHMNGTHFRVDSRDDNEKLREKISEMLGAVIKDHVPVKWYVDRSVFDTVHGSVDYKGIIENSRKV